MENSTKEVINIKPWMKEKEIKFRQEARDNLTLAAHHGLLPETEIDLNSLKTFSKGERSVVFCVNYGKENPYVVKMGTAKETIEAEPYFLEAWERGGIKVPRILGKHVSDEKVPVSLTVMEYIDAPLLSEVMDTEERINLGISRANGETLAKMHKITSNGFGEVVIGEKGIQGKFSSFREEIEDNLFKEKISTMIEDGVLDQKIYTVLNKSIDFLDQEVRERRAPSYTHNDYRPYNMFYKDKEIIIFDPNPKITHPLMCLASTLIKSKIETESKEAGEKEWAEILAGYSSVSPIDEKSLDAALIVRSIMTLHVWWKKDQKEKVQKLKEMMKDFEGRSK